MIVPFVLVFLFSMVLLYHQIGGMSTENHQIGGAKIEQEFVQFVYVPLRVREPGGRSNNFEADTLNE